MDRTIFSALDKLAAMGVADPYNPPWAYNDYAQALVP